MGDFTTLTRENATAEVRYSIDGVVCIAMIWTPNNPHGAGAVSGYRAPTAGGADGWPVLYFGPGGAGVAQGNLDLVDNTTVLELINYRSCAVVVYDAVAMGFYEPAAEDPRAKFIPHTYEDDAAAIIHMRHHCADESYFGVGGRISVDPARSIHFGGSEGAESVARTQLHPDGDFDYIDGVTFGQDEHRFARRDSHCCKFMIMSQLQVLRSSMVMSKFSAAVQARADDVLEPPLSTYTVNGPHSVGDNTIAVTGDTVAMFAGQRLQFGASSQEYALASDYAGGAGTITVQPALLATLSNGDGVTIVENGLEKYGARNQVWGQYDYSSRSGYIWQDDIETNDPDAVYPWELKRQHDVDVMATATNPRINGTVWIFIGGSSNTLITSALTGEQSFLAHSYAPTGTLADGEIDPSNNHLHGEHHAFTLAEAIYQACVAAGMTPHVYLACGNTTSNPNATLAAAGGRAWNLGQNADFTSGAAALPTDVSLRDILDDEGFDQ